MINIALDAMGGDFAPKEQVEGAMLAIKNIQDIEITLYGRQEEIEKYLTNKERINIVDCRDVIPMGEHNPLHAIRNMTDSSMVKAFRATSNKEHDVVVTCGPTQAVVVGAHIIIRRMEGFKRPALAPVIPSMTTGQTVILDCGANLEVRPEQLVQQAQYAVVYAKEVLGRENPSVGLLNIGTEEGKGRQFENDCYNALKESGLNFYGNVETKDILEPPTDILISDGFTTNMVVKCMEGTAKSMGKMLKQNLMHGFFGKIGALLSRKNLNRFKKQINPDEVAGGMIFGLKMPVIKAHGSSECYAVFSALKTAASVVRKDVNNKVQQALLIEKPLGE
ncbi:phosphate acyltransferase PlsX [bacterium]|nr:phosphate acyltransferase PlsX [bacterium]